MNKKLLPTLLLAFPGFCLHAQDTLRIEEVKVKAYFSDRPLQSLPATVAVIDSTGISKQPGFSFVPVMNTVPGVRMEERSSGSYRLSIRGSLLRSPFGIRNVKVYIDEFPFTDGGGNTYLNLLDLGAASRIEIIRGPDASLFGANSGGVLRITPSGMYADSLRVNAAVQGGSYGLFREQAGWEQRIRKFTFSVSESWQKSDGYRENSSFDRKYLQATAKYDILPDFNIRGILIYSSLNYRTPGGLTLQQWEENPRAARPATATLPGAAEQKAGVNNNTIYYGALAQYKIFKGRMNAMVAMYGSRTSFENPFITNYETREEKNSGVRIWLEYTLLETNKMSLTSLFGVETQSIESKISNYGNVLGNKDTVQAQDRLEMGQYIPFFRSVFSTDRWKIEASVSVPDYGLSFYSLAPVKSEEWNSTESDFQLMPRAALSYKVSRWATWRFIWSRGYSPPTLAEVRSSNNIINTDLQPESGWNYETGLRLRSPNNRFYWDIAVFYYELNNAIVRRLDSSLNEYFVNAGGTQQAGLESQMELQIIRTRQDHFIRGLKLSNSYTFSAFRFSNYVLGTTDYSGNRLTGVPEHVSVTGLYMQIPANFYLFLQHNFTSRLPLNDDNSVYAGSYNLVQVKTGWQFPRKGYVLEINAGIDNLLDERYSLGNDLNAPGQRYYNPAPARNYFAGLAVMLR